MYLKKKSSWSYWIILSKKFLQKEENALKSNINCETRSRVQSCSSQSKIAFKIYIFTNFLSFAIIKSILYILFKKPFNVYSFYWSKLKGFNLVINMSLLTPYHSGSVYCWYSQYVRILQKRMLIYKFSYAFTLEFKKFNFNSTFYNSFN